MCAFVGPGLGVRVLGDVTADNALEVLRNVRNHQKPVSCRNPIKLPSYEFVTEGYAEHDLS